VTSSTSSIVIIASRFPTVVAIMNTFIRHLGRKDRQTFNRKDNNEKKEKKKKNIRL